MTVKYSAFFPLTDGIKGTAVPATRNVNLGNWNTITNGTTLNVGDTVQYYGSTFVVVAGHIKGAATGAPDVNPNYQIYASQGANGVTTYTWIAYADSADGATNFTAGAPGARTYIGITSNQASATESTNNLDYTWSKMQGPQGPSIILTADKTGFIYIDGTLTPASQTINYTATLNGITGTITWTTSPNVKTATGATFSLSNIEIGTNSQVVVTATAGGFAQTIFAQKIADAASTMGAQSGINLRDSTNASLADAAIKNSAVTISSAGVLSGAGGGTINALNILYGPVDAGADVTLLVSGSKTINIACDYTGAVKTGQFPLDVYFTLKNGANTDVTTSASWAASQSGGSATFTPTVGIPNATGNLNVTALTTATVTITQTATYLGKIRTGSLTMNKVLDPPPTATSGNPGTTSNSSLSAFVTSGNIYGTAAATLSCVAGTAGQVACSLSDTFYRTSTGLADCYGKWQWRVVGGTFADVAVELYSDVSADRFIGGAGGYNYAGDLSCGPTMIKTGLTSGTTYQFQLLLRSAGAYGIQHNGTPTIVGT